MRTKVTITKEDGTVEEEWREQGTFSDTLENVIAFDGLDYVELVRKDGRVVRYTAWQFECEYCDSYEHDSSSCPEVEHD